MNPNTLVVVRGHADASKRMAESRKWWSWHECPVVVMSPVDSEVTPYFQPGTFFVPIGEAAYFGEKMLQRLKLELAWLDRQPYNHFLIHEWDSFCLIREIPPCCFGQDEIWFNQVTDPRPHESPYPKIALHAPWFLSRSAIQRMLLVADRIPQHPITPYSDWLALAMACEAGLTLMPFQSIELGRAMVHPVKTDEQLKACLLRL